MVKCLNMPHRICPDAPRVSSCEQRPVQGPRANPADKSWKPDFTLAGVGIHKKHCWVENRSDKKGSSVITLFVDKDNAAAVSNTFVNGDNFFFEEGEGCQLEHGDRIIIGQNYVFVFIDHAKREFVGDLLATGKTSYEIAKKELLEKQGNFGDHIGSTADDRQTMQKEFEKKLKEAEELKAKAQQDMEKRLKEREKAYEAELDRLRQEMTVSQRGEMSKIQGALDAAQKGGTLRLFFSFIDRVKRRLTHSVIVVEFGVWITVRKCGLLLELGSRVAVTDFGFGVRGAAPVPTPSHADARPHGSPSFALLPWRRLLVH